MSVNDRQSHFDQANAEALAGHMVTTFNNGTLSLLLSVGHSTGLFDAMRDLPPSTSEKIAKKASLHERYVREWLGAMVHRLAHERRLSRFAFMGENVKGAV